MWENPVVCATIAACPGQTMAEHAAAAEAAPPERHEALRSEVSFLRCSWLTHELPGMRYMRGLKGVIEDDVGLEDDRLPDPAVVEV
jgi:hypothetical protein